jgi:hypothetical protein
METKEPLACRLTSPELIARKEQIARRLGLHADSIEESSDFLVLTFSGNEPGLDEIARFIALERECCPFLAYRIEIAANGGPVTLVIGGSPEAMAFVRDELGDALPIRAASTAS